MEQTARPGPKPKRIYARTVRWGDPEREDLPGRRAGRIFLDSLERSGRLVADGRLTDPPGSLLLFRAKDKAEAERVLRADPFRSLPETVYDLLVWDPSSWGTGVNLDPPPARGAGRLTQLERVAVVVRDRASSVAWYRGVLGLELREDDPDTGFVELTLGKGNVGLSLVVPRREWGEPAYAEAAARIGTGTGIVFETDSVDALRLRLENAGVRPLAAPHQEPWGGRTIRFADPDGNEFLAFESARRGAPQRRPVPSGRRART